MTRSFGLVEEKVAEAEFFLRRIPESGFNMFAVRCYISAFASSARSVTFALQSCLNDHAEFNTWYNQKQEAFRRDQLARFFGEFRRVNQHIGVNPVGGGATGPGQRPIYFFSPTPDLSEVPSEDVEGACKKYFTTLLQLVFDCFAKFGPDIDPKQRYTEENFERLGKSIEDAEEEIIGVRGWGEIPGVADAYRWQSLRDAVPGCLIEGIYQEYLGLVPPQPARLPHFSPPQGEGWYRTKTGGRMFIPEQLSKTGDPELDLDLFTRSLKKNGGE